MDIAGGFDSGGMDFGGGMDLEQQLSHIPTHGVYPNTTVNNMHVVVPFPMVPPITSPPVMLQAASNANSNAHTVPGRQIRKSRLSISSGLKLLNRVVKKSENISDFTCNLGKNASSSLLQESISKTY